MAGGAVGRKRDCRWRRTEWRNGWGGRIRTFTVLINSEVSYQLDHAPAGGRVTVKHAIRGIFAEKGTRSISLEYHGS